jgi:4-hydroxy-3-methylbut-2-enyl diphosphate reductase
MTVVLAKSIGFCSGVRRAIRGAERALEEKGRIFCLGEIIHNPRVVRNLERKGLVVVDDMESVPDGGAFIVRSHGLPGHLLERAAEKGLDVHDFTCPRVKRIHELVRELSGEGYFVIVAGNPDHPEVKAIRSLAGSGCAVVRTPEEATGLAGDGSLEKTAVVVQTTFDPQRFLDIVKETVIRRTTTLVSNTLCGETLKRQREAIELAGGVDFIVVVGGRNSSNTRNLFEMVRAKVPAAHVEGSGELDLDRVRAHARIGIASGASTPEEEVLEVARLVEGYPLSPGAPGESFPGRSSP